MKKFLSFMLTLIAVLSALAAIVYWVHQMLSQEKCHCMFHSHFTEDDKIEAVPEEKAEPEPKKVPEAAPCGDAVCAVDMCMPY